MTGAPIGLPKIYPPPRERWCGPHTHPNVIRVWGLHTHPEETMEPHTYPAEQRKCMPVDLPRLLP